MTPTASAARAALGTMAPTPADLRATLAEFAPQELPAFDSEVSAAGDDTPAVLARWAGVAVLRANPLTPAEQAAVDRFRRTGDCTGLWERVDGQWVQL